MKNLLLTLFITALLFGCSKVEESKNISALDQKVELIESCEDDKTPYSTLDVCTKKWGVMVYHPWQIPFNGKNIITVNDSSSLVLFNKLIILDSLKYPFTGNNSNYIVNIDSATGKLGVSKWNTLKIPYANITGAPATKADYTNTVNTSGGAGQSVYYITSDKTSTGTALYTTIDYVAPQVNNPDLNYAFGWSYNATTKALTVTSKAAVGLNISLLGLTLLGVPSPAANGVPVSVFVKGH